MHTKPIMACITAQPHCTEIVKSALKLGKQLNAPVFVVTALPIKDNANERASALKSLNKISEDCGVKITIIYTNTPVLSLAKEAREKNPVHIFIGEDCGFLKDFRKLYRSSPITMVASGVVCTIPPESDNPQRIVV